MATETIPTIASDEDLIYCFVLADDHAPDAETATLVLIEEARRQWAIEWDEPPTPDLASRKWYKPDGETLVQCAADDPDRESEWWVFTDTEDFRGI